MQLDPHCLLPGHHASQHGSLSHFIPGSHELYTELCHIRSQRGWDLWQGEAIYKAGEGWVTDQLCWVPGETAVNSNNFPSSLQNISFRAEFSLYSEHIIVAWFLRATKLELMGMQSQLPHLGIFTSDFGENILVKSKHETGDQFFHRLEVCLFGTVSTMPSSAVLTTTETVSNIVTSDYNWVLPILTLNYQCCLIRVKDNKFVACALDGILEQTLEQARSRGLDIDTVITKVLSWLTMPFTFL